MAKCIYQLWIFQANNSKIKSKSFEVVQFDTVKQVADFLKHSESFIKLRIRWAKQGILGGVFSLQIKGNKVKLYILAYTQVVKLTSIK